MEGTGILICFMLHIQWFFFAIVFVFPCAGFKGFEPFENSSTAATSLFAFSFGNSSSTVPVVEVKMPASASSSFSQFRDEDIARAISLSLMDQRRESKDLAHIGKNQRTSWIKKNGFLKKNIPLPFPHGNVQVAAIQIKAPK